MEELTVQKAFESLKQLVWTGVPFNGSLVEIEQKKQAVEKLFEVLENGIKLEENGE